MTTVYLIRHAEAEGNLYRRCHGHYDSTITDNGYRQIAALAKRFADIPIDAVYSSDLTRTQTTALAITRTHDLPLQLEPRLREIGVGVWEDRTWTYLTKFDRAEMVNFNTDAGRWRAEGAETMARLRDRMMAALRDIIAAHPNQTVALFSHGMALRLLVGTLRGFTIAEVDKSGHGENTSVTKLEADEDGIRVVYATDASHLPEALTTLHKQLWTKTKGGLEPGIWFTPAGEHRFDVMQDDDRVGAVAVEPRGEGVMAITEFTLDEIARGRSLGIRLVGQAVSHARALGCDTLRVEVAQDNGLRRMTGYGFRAVGETARGVLLEKYFGKDEAYRIAQFDRAYQE